MPVVIEKKLPAFEELKEENIFIISSNRAETQDIRPLQIAIVNLMPEKIVTEKQLLRLIGNNIIQIEITFIHMSSHNSKNTEKSHLDTFYKTFEEIKDRKFDGMIVTGAPVEHLDFEDVGYWKELTDIFEYIEKNVTSTLFICWASQAALYHYFNIGKYQLPKKLFGVYQHKTSVTQENLFFGFDYVFNVPHSRHTEVRKEDILKEKSLEILSESDDAGVYISATKDRKKFFLSGHSEYDCNTLGKEYFRDKEKGLNIDIPVNYFPEDNYNNIPRTSWKSSANLLFNNWINYYVYQKTEYDITKIGCNV
ncbi:MAG: homoserine O-succinyltransferase [Eubacteriales bacterium]|jgi:homoserine O-succinyltransferase|nr:homoserine O-succinyltransferase [Eubacteriales bacterium]